MSVLLTGLVAFLPWVSEDRAEAQERTEGEKKQIAVDVWLVWCQRCLSMLNLVLDEPEGAKLSEDRVWLEVDFDRPENAGFFEKFPSGWREAEAAVMSARDEIAKLDRGS
ncbi:MAG: hypothetical protein HY791_20855 [Deltaproteobacteria bacterium]|nr:hypothetical protein [Deltaproteobacteria bacterium]